MKNLDIDFLSLYTRAMVGHPENPLREWSVMRGSFVWPVIAEKEDPSVSPRFRIVNCPEHTLRDWWVTEGRVHVLADDVWTALRRWGNRSGEWSAPIFVELDDAPGVRSFIVSASRLCAA